MTLIYKSCIKKFKKNPKKIFFYDLNTELSGSDCYKILNNIINFLKQNKIKSIGISSKNSIYWPLWYLAADCFCKDLFILNPGYSNNILNKIQKRYKINFIAKELDCPNITKNSHKNIIKNLKNSFIKNKFKNNILFTSGSTNIPKGVIITENSYLHVSKILIKKLSQKNTDLELLCMPFSHSFGLTRLRCVLLTESSALITDGLKNFPAIYQFSKYKKITGLSIVPSGIEIIKNLMKNKIINFSKNIKYFEIGSSTINEETRIWLKKYFKKTKIIHHYGTTEASRSFLRDRGKDDDFSINNNWIGETIKKVQFKIDVLSENFKSDEGELMIKGKNLFFDYLERKDRKNFKGWFKTGDLCKLKNSKVFLIGRTDNQLNIGGEKVHAEKIEAIIEKGKNVKECICFQTKDKTLLNKIVCLIKIRKMGNFIKFKKLILKRFKNFPAYYKPAILKFLDNLPKTNNGKKLRNQKELAKLYL